MGKLDNYANTGGFNRLAGRPSAPGSWKPSRYFWCWKVLYLLLLGIFMCAGIFFIIF